MYQEDIVRTIVHNIVATSVHYSGETMVKVEINGKQLTLDGILKTNLDRIKQIVLKDWDFLYVVDGIVGGGKSWFTAQLAYYLSEGKLTLDQICFNPKQFRDAILKAPKYSAVIFDEAFRGLSARAAMTQTNRMVVGMLQEIRQKNLFVFIVLPSIWDVDKYVALHRCKGLFHIHTDENMGRGYFKFYKKDKLSMMFANPQKWRYKYPAAPQFKGRFTKFYPLDTEAYKKKKEQALGEYAEGQEKKENSVQVRYRGYVSTLIHFCRNLGVKQIEIANVLNLSRNQINQLENQDNPLEKHEKVSNLVAEDVPNLKIRGGMSLE